MEIIFQSNTGLSRDRVVSYLRKLKADNPHLRVLDIGGAGSPWSVGVADAYVDIRPVLDLPTIVGDIHDPTTWERIRAGCFDFCICSHTLEDLRDPLFVLARIRETFRQGYIAVPSKHVEFSHIESSAYVGYAHHRWIFTLTPDGLRIIAKFPFASYFSPRRRPLARLYASGLANIYRRFRGRGNGLSAIGPLPWWDSAIAGPHNELAFIWDGDLEFEAINGDYAGESPLRLARLYHDDLAPGL